MVAINTQFYHYQALFPTLKSIPMLEIVSKRLVSATSKPRDRFWHENDFRESFCERELFSPSQDDSMDGINAVEIVVACAAAAARAAIAGGRARGSVRRETHTVQCEQFEAAIRDGASAWFVRMARCDFDTVVCVASRVQGL